MNSFLVWVINSRLMVIGWKLRIYSTLRAIKYSYTSSVVPGKSTVLTFLSKGTVESYRHTDSFLDAAIEYAAVMDVYSRWYTKDHVDAALEVYAKYGGVYSLSYLLEIKDQPIGVEFYAVN